MAAGEITTVNVGFSGSVRANMGDYEHSDTFHSLSFGVDVTGMSFAEIEELQRTYRQKAQEIVDPYLEEHYQKHSRNALVEQIKKEDPE
jgi:hypothetical protein